MAKRRTQNGFSYKQPSMVSGLQVKDILATDVSDLNKLNKKQMQMITGRLVSAGNKRLRRLEQAGLKSPAYNYIMQHGGYFSTKGKNLNQLRSEFIRIKNFMESETGNVKGAREFVKNSIDSLAKEGVNLTEDEFQDVMEAYEALKRNNPKVAERSLKYNIINDVQKLVQKGMSKDDILLEMSKEEVDSSYEKMQDEVQEQNEGVSGFFKTNTNWEDIPPL